MAKVTGVVEFHGDSKFGGQSIRVNGVYYNSKFDIKCKNGDTVEFDDGGKKYCQKLTVISGGSAPTGGTGKSATGTNASRDRSIIRQNALRHAAVIVAGTINSAKSVESDSDLQGRVLEMARVFESYSAGDEDVRTGPQYDSDGDFVE